MRIGLLRLSGDLGVATDRLRARYNDAEIISIPRSLLETGTMRTRLSAFRGYRADVLAVMTESLAWQYGQDALMLFGALGGARESLVIDSRGGMHSEFWISLILGGPLRVFMAFLRGKIGMRKALLTLDRLERKVQSHRCDVRQGSDAVSIAYLRASPTAGTHTGGAATHTNGVVNALKQCGVRLVFISNDEIAGLDHTDLTFHKISPKTDIMPRAAFDIVNGAAFSTAASRLIKSSPPDLIYQRYCRFSWAGVEAALYAGAPLFLEYNGSEVWVGKNWDTSERLDLLERCERLNLNAASRILVISEVEKINLLRAGVPHEKIVVNPNGVDPDEFKPGVGGERVRGDLGIAPNKNLVGFVGTFGPWHGVLALAEAIALTPKDSNLHFLFVGDGSLRPEVESKLRASGDIERVAFAGTVPHEHVPAFLDACDILVSPHVPLADGSDFFGSPTKLFEYMAAGKGIVASRLGQIGDVLVDNETALLVEPGNARELSDAIVRLSRDRGLLRRLGVAARVAAIEKHTWRRNAECVLQAFHETR